MIRALRPSPLVGWLLAGGCTVAAFLILGAVASALSPGPSGRPLSSYATVPQGVAAWAELLGRDGHAVHRLRTAWTGSSVPPTATVVVLLSSSQLAAAVNGGRSELPRTTVIQRFLQRGGRVVLGGRAAALAPALQGAVTAIPDPRFLENQSLGHGRNALRALALAGPAGVPVYFDEAVHGYGAATGLAALPTRWWYAIVALTLALAAWGLSRAVRLGGPDPLAEPPPSPRSAYILAMAKILERTADSDDLAHRLSVTLGSGPRGDEL